MSTTGGPATDNAGSSESGHVVFVGTCPFNVSQTESVTKVPGAPSCKLRAMASVEATGLVKLMKETYTCPVAGGASPGKVSSTASHWRSSITPGLCPQPISSSVQFSP